MAYNNLFIHEKKNARPFHITNADIRNTLIVGKMGMGKSALMAVMAECLYDLRVKIPVGDRYIGGPRVKIFDLFDGGRGENIYWIFPSEHPIYKHLDSYKKGYRSKTYPVRLLYPNTKKLPRKNLPIQSKVFTIPINSITTDDFKALAGDVLSASQSALWHRIKEMMSDLTTQVDFINMSKDMQEGRIKLDDEKAGIKYRASTHGMIMDTAFRPLLNEGLLSSAKCKTAINLKEETEDNKYISVLVLKYCPPQLHGFIINYFIKHVFEGIQMGDINKPKATYFMLREAERLLKSEMRSPSEAVIRDNINQIIKSGRGPRAYFMLDTQLLSYLGDTKSAPERIIVFQTPDWRKILDAMGYLKGSGLYNRQQLACFAQLPRQWCYVCEQGKKMFLTHPNIPRHKIWEHHKDDFDHLYTSIYGHKYYNPEDDLKFLEEENEKSRQYWKIARGVDKLSEEESPKPKKAKVSEEFGDEEYDDEEIEENIEIKKPKRMRVKKKKARPKIEKPKTPDAETAKDAAADGSAPAAQETPGRKNFSFDFMKNL